jgi:signal transduction histidine kinase/ligand-binding sensor domain-containing protein/DNA-binding response OmpR family regulator
MKKTILLTLTILFSLVSAWSLPYKITYLTADNGLSRNLVDYIFRDSRGFMWFCTTKGLDRYDGYEFVHFNSRSPVNPLISDNVHCVEEDTNGDLWIGTENGLYFLDYKTGEIINSVKKLTTKAAFTSHQIFFINKDEQGNLWVGYNSGLAKLHVQKDVILSEEIYHTTTGISSILFYNGNILVSHDNEIFRLIKGNDGKYKRVSADNKLRSFSGSVTAMIYDNGLIWIGTGSGLYKYDPVSENLTRYLAAPTIPNQLTSSYVSDIRKYKEGQLVIGTLMGLNIYDYQTDSFSGITSESIGESGALSNNFVNCLLVEDNTIWIGTDKGGVNLLCPDQSSFGFIGHSFDNPYSLSKNPVNAIYEDKDGDLFVGTVEGGLNIRKKGSAGFLHSFSQIGNSSSLSHNSVSCICQDYNGDYWIGTWGLGINRLRYKDKYKPVFEQFQIVSSKNSIQSNFVASLVPDNVNKGLWIGAREGIDFLDITTGKFRHVLNYLSQDMKIRFVTGMFLDSKRRLWVGTNYGLLCIYLNETSLTRNKIKYKYYRYLFTNPSSLIYEKINCIVETKDKRIWFGSNGNGIYSLDEKSDNLKFINFDERNGLLDNVVYGMLEDETGTLWISTDKGLCAYNSNRNSIRSYTKSDGLKSNQFYWDAYFKGQDGKMYFGSVAGITVFDPLKSTPINVKNTATITRIRILNDDVYPAKVKIPDGFLQFEGSKLSGIKLHESDKAFSIEFSALSYFQGEKIKYAYRLKGFDNNWTEVSSDRRFASFTNINNGSYELEVKCTNPDGTWSDQITTLDIRVIPPFYKTWWFLLIFLSLTAYGVYRYSIYRIDQFRKQKIQLKQMVDERTSEIEQQKELLEDQALQLQTNMKELIEHQEEVSRQNEILVQQNQKITHQKEQMVTLSKKVQDANFDKISFFTNITHEFRTPITLILGPVERSLKLSTNPKVLEQLHIVKRNSRLLLSLINQLMDFRKVDSGKMEITKTHQNFVEFLDDIILPFEDLVKDRGIVFHKQYRINPPEFLFDRDNMQKVLGNLLSNAIKFTPDYGTITVIASTYTDRSDQKERLYVSVKDTGKGVPVEDLEKIFERFYQSKLNQPYSGSGQSGTGIGLYLCKRIIQLHNGKIEAQNQNSGGMSFRFIIPIERRLSTLVSLDGKPMEMIVANQSVDQEDDSIKQEITKGKPVLLIVEDNSDMRQYIRSILSQEYNVLEAPNGVVGLEITNRYQPDLIVSDIMMPEMDGLEFCKRVKTNFTTSHIPLILLTAKSSTDTQIESFHVGADAFLVKPFDEELLKALIRNLNEKRKRIQMSFAENMDTDALNFDDESLDKKFLEKALKVIKENYTNPEFDVAEFIDAMGISRSLLHKKLTNLAGQSASRFIRNYRLNMGRELIIKNRATHSLNISEIAYEVGFNDPKYFTRCFTKHFGTQPSAFLDEQAD